MKTFLTLFSVIGLCSTAFAGEKCASACDKSAAACEKSCDKTAKVCEKSCDKTAEVCEKACDKSASACEKSCDKAANQTVFAVTGMTCGGCTDGITKQLAAMEGISAVSACHKSGHVSLVLDESKMKKSDVMTAITKKGYKVAGERVSFALAKKASGGCSSDMKTALEDTDGVIAVEKFCTKSGHAVVVFDPAKTSKSFLSAIIQTDSAKS